LLQIRHVHGVWLADVHDELHSRIEEHDVQVWVILGDALIT
jgi:hypothetical protein